MKRKMMAGLGAFALGVGIYAVAMAAFDSNAYIVSTTGLGNGGVAQVGAACGHDSSGTCRIYLYTGTNPAQAGQIILFDILQPAGQRPICTHSLVAGDLLYAGTFAIGHWPAITSVELDYWKEYPVTLINWSITAPPGGARTLAPRTEYAINLICPPRMNNHSGNPLPAQGPGAAPIGGPLPPR